MEIHNAQHGQQDNQSDPHAQQPTAHCRVREVWKLTRNQERKGDSASRGGDKCMIQHKQARDDPKNSSGCEPDSGRISHSVFGRA